MVQKSIMPTLWRAWARREYGCCDLRMMGSRSARKDRKAANAEVEIAAAPELRATMRKLVLLVHPDLFASVPEAAKENEISLAELQVIIV